MYFVIWNARIYPMDISDGRYPSILKSDIRLIYFFISLHAITSEKIKKKKNQNRWTTTWKITGIDGQQLGGLLEQVDNKLADNRNRWTTNWRITGASRY